jgi:hypothetical protein
MATTITSNIVNESSIGDLEFKFDMAVNSKRYVEAREILELIATMTEFKQVFLDEDEDEDGCYKDDVVWDCANGCAGCPCREECFEEMGYTLDDDGNVAWADEDDEEEDEDAE